jgi:hypothetical protein
VSAPGATQTDLDGGKLSVRRALKIADHGLDFGPPKNRASRRSVPLNKSVAAALRSHKARQNQERIAAREWHDGDLVFPNRLGKPMDPTNLYSQEYLFGLQHAGTGIFFGHSPYDTVAMMVSSTASGAAYAAVMLRIGTIWPLAFLHGLENFCNTRSPGDAPWWWYLSQAIFSLSMPRGCSAGSALPNYRRTLTPELPRTP